MALTINLVQFDRVIKVQPNLTETEFQMIYNIK